MIYHAKLMVLCQDMGRHSKRRRCQRSFASVALRRFDVCRSQKVASNSCGGYGSLAYSYSSLRYHFYNWFAFPALASESLTMNEKPPQPLATLFTKAEASPHVLYILLLYSIWSTIGGIARKIAWKSNAMALRRCSLKRWRSGGAVCKGYFVIMIWIGYRLILLYVVWWVQRQPECVSRFFRRKCSSRGSDLVRAQCVGVHQVYLCENLCHVFFSNCKSAISTESANWSWLGSNLVAAKILISRMRISTMLSSPIVRWDMCCSPHLLCLSR